MHTDELAGRMTIGNVHMLRTQSSDKAVTTAATMLSPARRTKNSHPFSEIHACRSHAAMRLRPCLSHHQRHAAETIARERCVSDP
jgi:hypothetical protein